MGIMTPLQRNHRNELFRVLRLFTSREEQLRYQREVPFVPGPVEVFCQWSACYDDMREKPWYLEVHPPYELAALDDFQHLVKTVRLELPDRLPKIHEFITTTQWERLASGASATLAVLENPGACGKKRFTRESCLPDRHGHP